MMICNHLFRRVLCTPLSQELSGHQVLSFIGSKHPCINPVPGFPGSMPGNARKGG